MVKPQFLADYSEPVTVDCERVLVTLFRGLGPWRESVFLIGGLAPRYLISSRPPDVPPHAGTADIDVVVDLKILADIEACRTLEQNLLLMGFQRCTNDKGVQVNWRWEVRTEHGAKIVLEFLSADPAQGGGKLQELPTKGNISAINIPHAWVVFDLHDRVEVTADLIGGNGRATETIRVASIVAFTCLKALAFEDRRERKDAHDLVYCLEHWQGGLPAVVARFTDAMAGRHREVVSLALDILRKRFCDPDPDEGYLREGPVAVARFEIKGGDDDPDIRESRALRQRMANGVVSQLLDALKDEQ